MSVTTVCTPLTSPPIKQSCSLLPGFGPAITSVTANVIQVWGGALPTPGTTVLAVTVPSKTSSAPLTRSDRLLRSTVEAVAV